MRTSRIVIQTASLFAVTALAVTGCAPGGSAKPEQSGAPSASVPTEDPTPTPTPTFDKTALSIDDPASIWVVSNKARPLTPIDYYPSDLVDVPVVYANPPVLRAEVSAAVVSMFSTYTAETGLKLASQSTFRSYASQTKLFNGYVSSMGLEEAERASARPGHSEHQTGLTLDIAASPANCSLEECFGDTPQGIWLRDNSWRFGFILRYPSGQEGVTGFKYEPWHYRYVGIPLATEYHSEGAVTLEGFFGLPAAPDYLD